MKGDAKWLEEGALKLLLLRNAHEVDGYADLIEQHSLLVRHAKDITRENGQLKNEILVLKHGGENTEMEDNGTTTNGVQKKLLKKIEVLQEQLNEKHAKDAASLSSFMTAVNEAKENQSQLQATQTILVALEKQYTESLTNEQNLKQELKLATNSADILRKELERVRILLDECEKENRSLSTQNRKLIKQMIEEKTLLMEEMNKMNLLLEQKNGTTSAELGFATTTSSTSTNQHQHAVLPGTAKHALKAHATEINSLVYNSAGSMVLTSSSDSTIRMWDTSTGEAKADLRGGGQPIMAVDITVDGDLVLGASNDRVCRIWHLSTGRVRHTFTGHSGKIYGAKFNVDGKQVVTGGTDRVLKIWDLNQGFCSKTLNCRSTCNDLAIATAGNIVSGHQDGALRFWDLRTQQMSQEIMDAHSQQITSVFFSHDGGTKILTNSKDNSLKLFDTRTFNVINTYFHEDYRTQFAWSKASLSPDSYYIASGSGDGSLFVWNVETTNIEKITTTHSGAIACCSWNNSGTQIASCDKNGFLILW